MEHASDFRIEPLTPDPGVFFRRTSHPLARRHRVSLADLHRHPILGPRLPARIRDWLVPDGAAPGQVVECESFAGLSALGRTATPSGSRRSRRSPTTSGRGGSACSGSTTPASPRAPPS